MAIIGQLEATGVAQHVRVDREWHLGGLLDRRARKRIRGRLSGNRAVACAALASRHPGLGAHWGFRS